MVRSGLAQSKVYHFSTEEVSVNYSALKGEA
jgi:hypothetical protein